MKLNSATDRLVIACYPPKAGGKFLINSLGLHDKCVFQKKSLLNINYDEKISYLHKKLDEAAQNKVWNDLDLGCYHLFNVGPLDYFTRSRYFLKSMISKEVKSLSNNDRFFFLVAHNIPTLKQYLKVWKNAKVIFFHDYHDFIASRARPSVIRHWNDVKRPDWPEDPPKTLEEIRELPEFVRDELTFKFNRRIEHLLKLPPDVAEFDKQLQKFIKNSNSKNYYFWDGNWYNSRELLLDNLADCYNWLGLSMHNKDDIVNYYNHWKNTLNVM
jgi:FMN phosphatase YigB (HAD superfamily)